MSEPTLDAATATAVYDVLVEHAGAREDDWPNFVLHQERGCREWRFMGALGFGGKFWHNPHRSPSLYVNCYPEDLTPERQEVIDRTNAALAELLLAEGCRAFAAEDRALAEGGPESVS